MIQLRTDSPQQTFGRFRGGERRGGDMRIGVALDIDENFLDLLERAGDLEKFGDARGHYCEDQNTGEVRQPGSNEIHARSPSP